MPLDAADVRIVWAPQPGPQKALVDCPFVETFFGGARGGGKTDGILGKWAIKSWRYGSAFNGVFFRREMPQSDDLIERAKEIYIPLGADWREQPRAFRMPGGGRIRFRPLENVTDAEKYQGQNLCVAVGTLIVMGDGSRCPVEQITPGDVVATLEGPRRVIWTTEPYRAPCVEAQVWNSNGEWIGKQVHPVWHPVLTTAGISPATAEEIAATPPGSSSTAEQTSSRTFPTRRRVLPLRAEVAAQCAAFAGLARNAGQGFPAWCAWSEDARNGHIGSTESNQEPVPPEAWSVPVTLHAPSAQSAEGFRLGGASIRSRIAGECGAMSLAISQAKRMEWSDLLRRVAPLLQWLDRAVSALGDVLHVPRASAVQGFPAGYLSGRGLCGELPRRYARSGQDGIRSQDDAVGLSRNALVGALGTIQTHNPTLSRSWVHPYSGEARRLVEAVTCGTMECRPIGDAWVTDLCVEGANHYISDTGLINKNTDAAVEEAGNYPDPKPIDMLFGALRSKAGVPIQLILTANPGGVGQQWIKYRYIDPAPRGRVPLIRKLPNGGEHRYIYIPSRVQDNRVLLDKDPTYINRLYLVGSPELVRAWLEGDWSVVSGAFFPEFSLEQHVVAPRSLPRYWQRFRSFDWGSARPFSVGWWAVSDGELPEFPRGSLVRYREWYGASLDSNGATIPNTGLRMTAEEVADGIIEREKGDAHENRTMSGVADPSIFAEDGGPSIADRMASRKVFFRAGDNARVAHSGAMGGWDQVRARLKGDGEKPAIYLFSSCREVIRTLPALQHDKDRAEDVDTDGEDHAADEVRYACMSRPYVAPLPASADDTERDGYARKWRAGHGRRGSAMAA